MSWGTKWDDKKQEITGKAIAKRQAEAGVIEWGRDWILFPSYKLNATLEDMEAFKNEIANVTGVARLPKDDWVTHTSNYEGIDFGNGAIKTEIVKVDKETVTVLEYYEKERNNKVPTHDPYTNPGAHVYYSCKCGQILDPGTKSFAQLNNAASEAGWKIRFGDQHYEAHCVECGKLIP